MLLLALCLLITSSSPARAHRLAVMMSGSSCPDASLTTDLEAELLRLNTEGIPHRAVATAVARIRAERALDQARQLYTRTNFNGCMALLSISELELGRHLADAEPSKQLRMHILLARIMLWLGICQWSAGEPQLAAASFVRSAQLPSSPAPDPELLPPDVVSAYRLAVATVRQEVSCSLKPPLLPQHIQINGKGPTVSKGNIKVPAGAHYLVIKADCQDSSPECQTLRQQVGPNGMRSLRLEASGPMCNVQLPAVPIAESITCINASEASQPGFIAEVTRQVEANESMIVDLSLSDRVALKLHRAGANTFHHQLVSKLQGNLTAARFVVRNATLLLRSDQGVDTRQEPAGPAQQDRWYTRWWVWALAGSAVAATIATVVVVTAPDRHRVVFGP